MTWWGEVPADGATSPIGVAREHAYELVPRPPDPTGVDVIDVGYVAAAGGDPGSLAAISRAGIRLVVVLNWAFGREPLPA